MPQGFMGMNTTSNAATTTTTSSPAARAPRVELPKLSEKRLAMLRAFAAREDRLGYSEPVVFGDDPDNLQYDLSREEKYLHICQDCRGGLRGYVLTSLGRYMVDGEGLVVTVRKDETHVEIRHADTDVLLGSVRKDAVHQTCWATALRINPARTVAGVRARNLYAYCEKVLPMMHGAAVLPAEGEDTVGVLMVPRS